MGANAERQLIRGLYGDAWRRKVDAMSDSQVIAIYLKMKREGKIK